MATSGGVWAAIGDLRDQHIENVSIDADAISQISAAFAERLIQLQSVEANGAAQALDMLGYPTVPS